MHYNLQPPGRLCAGMLHQQHISSSLLQYNSISFKAKKSFIINTYSMLCKCGEKPCILYSMHFPPLLLSPKGF